MPETSSSVRWSALVVDYRIPLLMLFAVGWCLTLLAGRIVLTGSGQYAFLVWNLFLAAIPLLWSALLAGRRSHWQFWGCAGVWLLFFPNAPYVLTDFIHLHPKSSPVVPLWYDVALLANFGLLALVFGLYSLRQVHAALERRTGRWMAALLVSACTLLAGFGIYLGRFLRWNSWDIVARPGLLLADVADRFLHPFSHPRTWVFTFLYGGTLFLLYWIAHFHGERRICKLRDFEDFERGELEAAKIPVERDHL